MFISDSGNQQEIVAPTGEQHSGHLRAWDGPSDAAAAKGGEMSRIGVLRPLVDSVARINASVYTKLLSGFVVGALLLLGMYILSLVVIH